MKRLFLLSPANCAGARARMVMRAEASFPLAVRLRTTGAPLGEVFAFMSGLYFRGKLTYAAAFGDALVITTNRGLVAPDVLVTTADLAEMAGGDIHPEDPSYRRPLLRDLRRHVSAGARERGVVLLGSVATGKYVDVLTHALGERLLFPSQFVGRGDMSRGGLMLRCAAAGEELSYQPVLGAVRRGKRPPKLPALSGKR
ncbi:MAG: hypothetical protein HY904_08745 [Deltaproteobacteria bacterium]|nr:hypothetical protein [Deltaproteobacteria bacterium]